MHLYILGHSRCRVDWSMVMAAGFLVGAVVSEAQSACVDCPPSYQAVVTVVVGSTFGPSTPDAAVKAESLKCALDDINNCMTTVDLWIVKVQNGPYQFAPAVGAPLPKNAKPLQIEKNIHLIGDDAAGPVTLDGGASTIFGGDPENPTPTQPICVGCFGDTPNGPRSNQCDWFKTTVGTDPPVVIADANALIQVNSSSKTTDRRTTWDIRIENFEMRYAFRNGGHNVTKVLEVTEGQWQCSGTQDIYPGGAIEAWYTTITIDGCWIHHNSVTNYQGRGGGIFASSSNVTIDNTTIENNLGGYYGGGLFVSEGTLGSGSPCCDADRFPRDAATVTITGSVFRENFAEYGGGFQLGAGLCQQELGPPPCSDPDWHCGPSPGIELVADDNLIEGNCVSRYPDQFDYVGSGSSGSGIYIPQYATITSIRHNTIAENKCADDNGALYVNEAEQIIVENSDAIERNIFTENIGAAVQIQCTTACSDTCGTVSFCSSDWCVQDILKEMENNLFWKNKDCSENGNDKHVVIGLGRELSHETPSPAPCTTSLTPWTCGTDCNETNHYLVRWYDDPAIVSCRAYAPSVPTSNKVFDPGFCSSSTEYELNCCSGAFIIPPFGTGDNAPGWRRNQSACPTSECPGDPNVIASSMVMVSEPHADPDSLVLRFVFDTTAQAEKFEVRYKLLGAPAWEPTLSCPGGSCVVDVKHGETTTSVYPCALKKYVWQARTMNCRNDPNPTTPEWEGAPLEKCGIGKYLRGFIPGTKHAGSDPGEFDRGRGANSGGPWGRAIPRPQAGP